MKKILMIIPYDSLYKYRKGYTKLISYEPITMSVLAALIPKEYEFQIDIVDEGMEHGNYNKKRWDIVAISSVTSAAPRAYELAKFFKEKGSYVVMGGHHITLLPDEAAEYADTIFIGRSEKSWPQFFHDYMNGTAKKVYEEGCSGEGVIKYPIPRRDLIKRKNYLKQPVIIANHSCTNRCNFCCISNFHKGKSYKREIGDVVEEIKSLKTKEFIFLDPNQYSDREYAMELYRELEKLKIKWVALGTNNITEDGEMLESMVKAGCSGLFIGFESMNQTDISDIGKSVNRVTDYKKTVEILHNHKIAVTGSFILGLDSDTKESLLALPDKINDLKLDFARFGILCPAPNTPIYNKLESEGRILTKEWGAYDSMHCVYQPKNMEPHELEEIFLKVWQECYSMKKIWERTHITPDRKLIKFLGGIGFKIYIRRLEQVLREHRRAR